MSVLSAGYGAAPFVVTQGYAPSFALRETFVVPAPDGSEAQRTTPSGTAPYLGSQETSIAFGLSFAPWLAAGEILTSVVATIRGLPRAAGPDVDATSSVLQAARPMAGMVVFVLHGAQVHLRYVITCSVQTSAGRTLECRMPPIWCPD